jgi:geranylgeranyl pyrophosphate synthase
LKTKNEQHLVGFLTNSQNRVERTLEQWLPSEDTLPHKLHRAMRYAVLDGGKRVRPVLVYASGQALDIDLDRLDGPACAVELIHAYSLVHDDLPAMDNDDLRRGKPTCHKRFDEATAILTGDALQTLAFKVLCQDQSMQMNSDMRLQMIDNLAIASGSRGMAGGQAIDLDSVGKDISLIELENMHIHKTGALILAAVRMGYLAQGDASHADISALDHYAKRIGLAFQVKDDILDIEGDTETLGKTQGKDQKSDKPTYPSLMGLDGARKLLNQLHQEAIDSLSIFDDKANQLRWIADYIVHRHS